MTTAVVVGGGISGLSAARLLAMAGFDVIVLGRQAFTAAAQWGSPGCWRRIDLGTAARRA